VNYLNEWNPFVAQWCRNLIEAGELPDAMVCESDIREIDGAMLDGFTQCHFFAGIGGWPLALRLAGWPADFPVWTGSCPCQPFAACGPGGGMQDERHLWPDLFRLIEQCRPVCVFGEQSADAIRQGWFDALCDDVEGIGYTVRAAVTRACFVGAPHKRRRLYFVAYSDVSGLPRRWFNRDRPEQINPWARGVGVRGNAGRLRQIEPGVSPLAHGLPRSVGPGGTRGERLGLMAAKANRVGRIEGYGNAIVPQVAAVFVRSFMDSIAGE